MFSQNTPNFSNSDAPAGSGAPAGDVNPKKLFVGNLPYSTTEDQLNELFSQYGQLTEVKLITDRMTGRSRGIAFVEFANEEEAAAAVEAVNGYELDGRALMVNIARPQAPRENRGFGGGGRSGGGRGFGGGGGGFRGGDRGGYRGGRGGDRGGRSQY
jgi:cold-inducible RNA-binding protein